MGSVAGHRFPSWPIAAPQLSPGPLRQPGFSAATELDRALPGARPVVPRPGSRGPGPALCLLIHCQRPPRFVTDATMPEPRSGCSGDRALRASMTYEPGSNACRVLIESKAQVEMMLLALSRIEESAPIRAQLLDVYQQLERLHDRQRRSSLPASA
jgi:hypothetical protein